MKSKEDAYPKPPHPYNIIFDKQGKRANPKTEGHS